MVKKYQAIVFDFGNIFMALDYPKLFSEFSTLLGFDFKIETIPPDLMAIFERHEKGEITDEEWVWAFQKIKPELEPRDLIKAWNGLLVGMQKHHFDFLRELRKDYKLYLLSNINSFHERWIDAYMKKEHQIDDFKTEFFDGYYYSHHIGKRKPENNIYEFVGAELRSKGINDWLFIDDKSENILAAKANGWSAVEHLPEDDISKKLEQYLQMEIDNKENRKMKFGTKAIHAGVNPDPSTGAIMTPIFQTSTYVQSAPGEHKGYAYARTKNPTRDVLQTNLAALENGKHAICYSSGLAAMDAVLKLLKTGDEIIGVNDMYGGSYRQMTRVYSQFGIKSKFVDMANFDELETAIGPDTKLLWLETPTNPMLKIIDIQKITKIAKSKGVLTCVDNTFASPYLQNPLDLGADLVMHSATKYINGHSDVILGAVVTSDQELADKLYFIQNAVGAVPGPQDCFLTIRGIKTLHVRVQRACENANEIAHFLRAHDKVSQVYYPGFADHPNHDVAKAQMRDFGAMMSFDLHDNSQENAYKVMSSTHYFSLAESLGGVESLIGHPASMTHAAVPKEDRLKVGLTDSLIRLSIGIEDVEDLKEDLAKALS